MQKIIVFAVIFLSFLMFGLIWPHMDWISPLVKSPATKVKFFTPWFLGLFRPFIVSGTRLFIFCCVYTSLRYSYLCGVWYLTVCVNIDNTARIIVSLLYSTTYIIVFHKQIVEWASLCLIVQWLFYQPPQHIFAMLSLRGIKTTIRGLFLVQCSFETPLHY